MLRILLLWLITFAAAWTGSRAGNLSKLPANIFAACSCLFLAAGGLLAKNLRWLPESLICPEVVYMQYAWFTPPAAFLFFLGARQTQINHGKNPRVMKLFVLLLVAFSTFRLADQQGWLLGDIDKSAGTVSADGIVLQTTASTCGASSCANLLRQLEIDPQATEAQMIPLCQTGMHGSTPLGMASGLKFVAGPAGWHVKILQCGVETIMKLKRPAVISLGTPFVAQHAVVLLSINERRAMFADPIGGLRSIPIGEFQQYFMNEAVLLYRDDPFENVP